MKKLVVILLFIGCISPAFAQWEGIAKVGAEAAGRGAELTAAVTRKAAAAVQEAQASAFRLVRLINMPKEPLLRVQLPQTVISADDQIISARVLNGADFSEGIFPQDDLIHLPLTLNDAQPALYRGLGLKIADIKDILTKGMGLNKSYYQKLFFSSEAEEAVFYADKEEVLIPVVVKVNVTPESQLWPSLRLRANNTYTISQEIPARFISDMVAFLEVNGEGAWYKAVLVDGELTFVPAPTRLFETRDLIVHRFRVPREW